ncbi:MAG: peptide chain release factor N(5)-glutamine methyltransferase [Bacteroidales bacterium]
MTLHDEMSRARRRFERAGIDAVEAAVDAELLARCVLAWDRARLLASARLPPPAGFFDAYEALVTRRERREPAAYVVGSREFWNRDFEVGPGVLVPRPETEFVVEEALETLPSLSQGRAHGALGVADVGTGTGCLAVTLALECPQATVVATDVSPAALDVARRNAARHGVADRITFVETSVLAEVDRSFHLIVSNPPYVPTPDLASLPPEVRDYEPVAALAGGDDGLDVVRELLLQAESRLRRGGLLIFEFGFGQEGGVRQAIAARPAFCLEKVRQDLQGIPRTAVVRFNAGPGLSFQPSTP